MTTEENKALIRRFYAEIDVGNIDAPWTSWSPRGDKVLTRLTAYGRHEGELPGPLPATRAEMRETAGGDSPDRRWQARRALVR